MENASRALIMAASTMIALMVLAAMIYLFRQGALLNEHYDTSQISRNLELYNSKFLKFNRDNNSFSDIISVCNLAYDVNVGTEYSPNWVVEIIFKIGDNTYTLPSAPPSIDGYKRNCVIHDGRIISLYEMAQTKATDLGMSVSDVKYSNYKITESSFFTSKGFKPDGSPSDVDITKQEQVFLFKCNEEDIEINRTGRVKKMQFDCVVNGVDNDHVLQS